MVRVSGAGNIHSDPEMAKTQGLGGVIAQGGQLTGYLSEMMTVAFGDGFLRGGEISVKFIHPVRPGDAITTGGTVLGDAETPQGTRVDCEIWIENQHGQKVVVGTANAIRHGGKA
jgi:acyl dehydratase